MKEGAVVVDVVLIEAGVVEGVVEPLLTQTALGRRRLPSSLSRQKNPLHGILHRRAMMDRTHRRLLS